MKSTNASKRKSVTFDANNSNTSSASQIDDESPASSDSSSVADKTQYNTANNSMVLTSDNDTDNEPSKVAKSGIEVQKLKKINSESILDTLLGNQSSSAEAEIAKFKEAGGNTLEEFLEYVKQPKSSPKEIQISNLNNTKSSSIFDSQPVNQSHYPIFNSGLNSGFSSNGLNRNNNASTHHSSNQHQLSNSHSLFNSDHQQSNLLELLINQQQQMQQMLSQQLTAPTLNIYQPPTITLEDYNNVSDIIE